MNILNFEKLLRASPYHETEPFEPLMSEPSILETEGRFTYNEDIE